MKFNWKVEDMALMNEKSNIYIGNEKIYNVENELTRQEKIEFLDSMNDGLTSYILNLADKLKEDKEDGVIKKDIHGEMKAMSYTAWINRNDTRNCIGNSMYNRGIINFSPCRDINRIDTDINMFKSSTYSDYVDEAFHIKLKDLEYQEKQYFKEHDDTEILKRKVSENIDKYGTFGLNIWKSLGGLYIYKDDNPKLAGRELILNELKFLNSKYEELEKHYEKITNEMPQIDYEHEYNPQDNQSVIPKPALREFIDSEVVIRIENQEQLDILLSQLRNEDVKAPIHIHYDSRFPYFFIDKITNKLKANHNFNNISRIYGYSIEHYYNFSDFKDMFDFDSHYDNEDMDKQGNKQENEPVIDLD